MILTGPEIHKRVREGSIEIEPFREAQLNPASYDLRLGQRVAVYADDYDHNDLQPWDCKQELETLEVYVGGAFNLWPGTLYLMHTEEVICAHDCVSVIDGKSSLGRLGISCHQTAGYGDPGFRGQYTFEVTVVHPVIVYAGMRFCQIRFHEVVGEIQKYDGNYQGETSMGPVASRSWRQFEEDR